MRIYFFITLVLNSAFLSNVYAHGGGGEMGGNVGPKKGIKAISHEDGMTVSPEAIKRLDLQNMTLTGIAPWIVSKEGIIFSKDDKFVYLVKNGNYKSVPVEAISIGNGNYKINSWQLKTQDQIVIKGASLLRTAELDAGPEEEEEEGGHEGEHKDEHESEKHEDHDKHDHTEEAHHD